MRNIVKAFVLMGVVAAGGVCAKKANAMSDEKYQFSCSGVSSDGAHHLVVNGGLNATRGTLGGESVGVVINDTIFEVFHLPAASFWVRQGELSTMRIHGVNNKMVSFTLYYTGEGAAQNYLEISKRDQPVWTKDVSCTMTPSPW